MLLFQPEIADIEDQFLAIRRQESCFYNCVDYFSPEFQAKQTEHFANDPKKCCFLSQLYCGSSFCSSSRTRINECWREKICEWSYQVIDHFDFNREIVSISMSYLDRYLCTCPVNRKVFQLAGLTSLYMAIKLHESSNVKMSSFIELSRGYFSVDHIIAMERSILRGLSWHVHPPTPLSVVKLLMLLIPVETCYYDELTEIKELARFLTELSVCDYFFTLKPPMTTGLAVLLTAIELIDGNWKSVGLENFLHQVQSIAKCDYNTKDILECKSRLRETYIQGGYSTKEASNNDRGVEGGGSPVCVSHISQHQDVIHN